MINDLTDEIFWLFTVGVCILFIMRFLSPPPAKYGTTLHRALPRPRHRSRRRAFRERWLAPAARADDKAGH